MKKVRKYLSKNAMPDFLFIGAQKSGTTSLYEYIGQHPQIIPSSKKEVHFFDTKYYKGRRWYRSHFPARSQLQQKITGEASPSYLFYPGAAQRIRRSLPEAKLLVLLRDPVDRAISSYYHQQRKGVELLSLKDALDAEEKRLERFRKKLGFGWLSHRPSKNLRQYAYKTKGLYAMQLKTYFRFFSPQQIWIEQAERFFAEPKWTIREVCQFLEVDDDFVPSDLKPRNVGLYEQVPREIREQLQEYYHQPNQELFELLGRNFDWQ